jgi:hypothetical protein
MNAENADIFQTSLSGLIIFLVSLYSTKCAMMAFLGRVTSSSDWARAYHILNGFVGLLGLGSVLLAVISCSASSGFYWNIYRNLDSCPAQVSTVLIRDWHLRADSQSTGHSLASYHGTRHIFRSIDPHASCASSLESGDASVEENNAHRCILDQNPVSVRSSI